MIVALALLSVAMIAGGLYGVLQGWEIVVLERGWALVIASSIAAASGALLLGLTAAVARLGGIRKDLAQLGERLARAEMPVPTAFDPSVVLPPTLLAESGAAAPPEASVEQREDEPLLPLFMRPADEPETPEGSLDHSLATVRDRETVRDEPDRADREMPPLRIPDYLFRSREDEDRRREPRELRLPEPEEPAAPEPQSEPEIPAPAEETPEPAEIKAEPETPEEREEKPAAPAPTVIGSYTSGDNRYIMYSDGSIEAETPQGDFRFDSLDELKAFIAAGGERSSEAAAS